LFGLRLKKYRNRQAFPRRRFLGSHPPESASIRRAKADRSSLTTGV